MEDDYYKNLTEAEIQEAFSVWLRNQRHLPTLRDAWLAGGAFAVLLTEDMLKEAIRRLEK